jgi:ribosome-associated protein
VLVDFGDVIVHLLSPDRRDYYRLEDLWAKGKVLLRLQ